VHQYYLYVKINIKTYINVDYVLTEMLCLWAELLRHLETDDTEVYKTCKHKRRQRPQ